MTDAFARRYRLLDRIAIGGTAEVFRAQLVSDEGGERPVVIKRVLPQFARDDRFRRLFLEEACVAVTLAHKNIVRVLDHGEIGQTCYIALEPVDGKDLGSLLTQARAANLSLRFGLAALIAAQVAEALQFIHDHTSSEGLHLRIIHRDVSPQNILISRTGDVKLTDFGIAKSAIRKERTVDGTIRGKLAYMAPEQASAEEDIDHRADIFGLGCVLYEMLVGQPPFRGDTDLQTIDRLRQGKIYRTPESLDLPRALKDVLRRSLEPNRRVRYQHASAMASALNAFASGLEIPPDNLALATWVVDALDAPDGNAERSAADDAVRMLLGDVDADDLSGPAAALDVEASSPSASPNTSVFAATSAVASPEPTGGNTAEVSTPPAKRKRWLLALPLLFLGLLGWMLWAIDRPDENGNGKATIGSDDARVVVATADASTTSKVEAGVMRIASRPSEAAVFVDRAPKGKTPLALRLPPKPFTLEIKRSGYTVWRRKIDPEKAEKTLLAMLARVRRPIARVTGYLTVNSLPWTRVFIDGVFVGNTPLLKLKVRAGKRRVALKNKNGAIRRSFVAVVPTGGARSYTFDLTK